MSTCTPKVRARILIETATETQNALGEITETWATLCQPWAEIEHKPGNETWTAEQQYAEGATMFTLRYDGRVITAKDRIQFDGSTFDILDIRKSPAVRARHQIITAKTRRD